MGLKRQYQIKRQQRYRARKKRRKKAGALKVATPRGQQQQHKTA